MPITQQPYPRETLILCEQPYLEETCCTERLGFEPREHFCKGARGFSKTLRSTSPPPLLYYYKVVKVHLSGT
jgi:hypothetical protein